MKDCILVGTTHGANLGPAGVQFMASAENCGWLSGNVLQRGKGYRTGLPSLLLDVINDQDVPDDSLVGRLEVEQHICLCPDVPLSELVRHLQHVMTDVLQAEVLLSTGTTPRFTKAVERQCAREFKVPNRYPSDDGWLARVGALRRLLHRHSPSSLRRPNWWAEILGINWGHYGNSPAIKLDVDCHVFQPLDDMVRWLSAEPGRLRNERSGTRPVFLQRVGSASLVPWMEMVYPAAGQVLWERYTGEYDKQFYDVVLDNGEHLQKLWPNAGRFNDTSGLTDRTVADEQVVWIKPLGIDYE